MRKRRPRTRKTDTNADETHNLTDAPPKFTMNDAVLLSEQCGSLGSVVSYSDDGNKIVRLCAKRSFSNSLFQKLQRVFREVFLPHGYPDSVSEDYFGYQIWDTVQAFCSTITGTFTTQAVLKGVGVGNAEATPLAAAITWVMKDGTGMLGRIIFAWWKGNSLDSDCKKWRLFADILNDSAMFLELMIPYFGNFTIQVLCVTTTLKAVVGVAGGATRASITQHQAIKGNMADVSAKDGSQETCVNLIASIIGVLLLALFNEGQYDWTIFMVFTAFHLLANYLAVGALIFKNLNNARLLLVLQLYLTYDTVTVPYNINKKESLLLGFGIKAKRLCGFDIKIGCSLKDISKVVTAQELKDLIRIYDPKPYLIVANVADEILYVALKKNESAEDVIAAYFHAVMIGFSLSKYNNSSLAGKLKRHLHHVTPLIRLNSVMKPYPSNRSERPANLPLECLKNFNEYINSELNNFFTALKINGWSVDSHAIELGQWRYSVEGDDESDPSKKDD